MPPLEGARPDDIDVRWSGSEGKSRVTSRGYTHRDLRLVVHEAVLALGADLLTGGKARPTNPDGLVTITSDCHRAPSLTRLIDDFRRHD